MGSQAKANERSASPHSAKERAAYYPGHYRQVPALKSKRLDSTGIGLGGVVTPLSLPHHRTCGSASGGSVWLKLDRSRKDVSRFTMQVEDIQYSPGCASLSEMRQCIRPMARRVISCLAYAAVVATLCPYLFGQTSRHTDARKPPEYTFKIIRTFPHDPNAFTQGLAYRNGFFYEGTGLNGRSSLRQVRMETGEVLQRIDLAPKFFGEGITLLDDQIIQLTWQSQT